MVCLKQSIYYCTRWDIVDVRMSLLAVICRQQNATYQFLLLVYSGIRAPWYVSVHIIVPVPPYARGTTCTRLTQYSRGVAPANCRGRD